MTHEEERKAYEEGIRALEKALGKRPRNLSRLKDRELGPYKRRLKTELSEIERAPKGEVARVLADMQSRAPRRYQKLNLADWRDALEEDFAVEVAPDGLIEPYKITGAVAKLIGDNPIALYHHTATGIEDAIRKEGLKVGKQTNFFNSQQGVYLSTLGSGTPVDMYARRAALVHGGDPLTLRVKVRLADLIPDPDDADLAWAQGVQFVHRAPIPPQSLTNPSYDIPPAPDEGAFLAQIARMKQAERRWRDMADQAKDAGRDWKHPFLQWHEISSDIYQMVGLRPVQLGHRLFAKGALAVEFTHPQYPGKKDIVSRVPQPGRRSEWRVTNIWSDGLPGGHVEKKTLLEALREVGRGMRPTRAAFPTEQPDMVSNPPLKYRRGLRVRFQTPLHGVQEGEVDKKFNAATWMIKTDDGRVFMLPPSELEVVGKAKRRSGRAADNAALVDAYLAAHPDLPVIGRAVGGEKLLRAVYDIAGGELQGNTLDVVDLPPGPGLYGYHVTREPENWIRVLEEDYERDPKQAKIVEVVALPGDALIEDVQQAIPSELFGRTLDSAILVTGREFLRKNKDWSKA